MSLKEALSIRKIEDEVARQEALEVLAQVYQEEKGWVPELETLLPAADLDDAELSWFLASIDDRPIGVTRVLYRLPVELYDTYGFQLVKEGIDVAAFLAHNRIAEVGRFAVLPEYRDKILVAAALMRAAATETVHRGFSHFITDVFEADPNSPYKFHQRILGFETVATHDVGELECKSRRITMLLDLKAAFGRLRRKRNWIFRYITQGWDEGMVQRLGAARRGHGLSTGSQEPSPGSRRRASGGTACA